MNPKYIIYGAGKRGKFALDLIGKEKVYAFVDRNVDKVGTFYCDIPVIGMEELKDLKEEYIYIISPFKGAEEIIDDLEQYGITTCIKWKIIDLMLKSCSENVYGNLKNIAKEKKVAICDISLCALLLYEYLQDLGCVPVIAVKNKSDLEKYCWLNSIFELRLFEEHIKECDVVIYMESEVWDDTIKEIQDKKKCINLKDLCEDSFSANEEIKRYKDIHEGERCFIVATGPSLRVEDLDLLEQNNEICISMNRIYNIFESTKWRPDYYIIQDLKMIEDLKDTISSLALPVKFVSGVSEIYREQEEEISSMKFNLVNWVEMGKLPFFSTQVDKCIYEGMTVTYACLQMAAYMGFKEIYLLGLDHNYSNDLYSGSNHFAGYDTDKKIRLNTVYIGQNELAYVSAKKYAEQNGIKIYNATRGGKLEVFERKEFDSLF